MRIFGFILICTLGVANVVRRLTPVDVVADLAILIALSIDITFWQTLKRRLPPVNVSGGLLNLKVFRSPAFTVYTIASFVAFLGLYTGPYCPYISPSIPILSPNTLASILPRSVSKCSLLTAYFYNLCLYAFALLFAMVYP